MTEGPSWQQRAGGDLAGCRTLSPMASLSSEANQTLLALDHSRADTITQSHEILATKTESGHYFNPSLSVGTLKSRMSTLHVIFLKLLKASLYTVRKMKTFCS